MIAYPTSKKPTHAAFILNSDDYNSSEVRLIGNEIRRRSLSHKYYRKYSTVKSMSFGIFHVDMKVPVDWDENTRLAKEIIIAALGKID